MVHNKVDLPDCEVPKEEGPGDYGWDSAGFSSDPEAFERFREAELIHGRWAMLGALGCIGPELTGGAIEPNPWFNQGALIFQEGGLNYFGNENLIHAQDIRFVLTAQVIIMAQVEAWRANGVPLKVM